MAEEKRADSTMDVLLEELEDEVDRPAAPGAPGARGKRSAGPSIPPPPPRAAHQAREASEPITEELDVDALEVDALEVDALDAVEPCEAATTRAVRAAEELIAACEAELRTHPDERRAGRLHYEMARLFESPLSDPRRAAMHYQESLKRQPDHLPSVRGARRALLARRSYQAALPLFEAEARLTPDPRAKAALLHARGRLLEDVLGRKDEARQAYTSALELDRGSPVILRSLIARALEDERYADAERLLEEAANALADDPRHRAALIAERAQLVEAHLGDEERAAELYATALRLDPRAPGALGALKRLHHAQSRWRDLIGVLRLEAELAEAPAARRAALLRVAQLQAERLGNRSEAIAALEEARSTVGDDPLVLTELARLYELAGRWDALADVLQALSQRIREPRERLPLLHRIGALYEQRLQHAAAALHWYEAALAIDPAHAPTVQALAPLYAAEERWSELIRLHLGEAEHARDRRRRAAARVRVAELHEEKLQQTDAAIEHYRKALAIEPTYPAAFRGLARLLSRTQRHRELVQLHERALETSSTDAESVAHLLTIGTIQEELLDEPAQAVHAYQRLLKIQHDHLQAIQALQRAAERAGRYRELAEALETEAALAGERESEDRLVGLLHRAGLVRHRQLGETDEALALFRRVLEVCDRYRPALRSLGQIYQELGRWDDLLAVYRQELELLEDEPQALALLDEMADLCRERIGREDEAVELSRRALAIDPGHGPAIRALTQHLRARGDWPALLEVLRARAETLDDPTERAQTACAIGLLYEERLNQPNQALAAYREALAHVPDHRPARDAVARLRVHQKDWGALAEDLQAEAENAEDRRLRVDALVRRGELQAGELNEPRKAIACFEAVLADEPEHLGAVLALENLYRRVGAWPQLADLHASQGRTFTDRAARIAALEARARLLEARKLGEPSEVAEAWRSVLALAPTHPDALRGLEAIALTTGDPALLADVDRRWAELLEDPTLRASHWTRLGESLEALGRDEALDAFRRALEDDPESLAAAHGFARAAARADDPSLLAESARRLAAMAPAPAEKAELLVQSAVVRIDRLGDTEGALADLEQALEHDPNSPEAAQGLLRLSATPEQKRRLVELLKRAAAQADAPRAAELWLDAARLEGEALGHPSQAIASLRRVLQASPNHVPALRALADYLIRESEWSEAAQTLSRIVQLAPDDDTLQAAHLELAELWSARLGDRARALVSLQAVLQVDPDNVRALTRLADLHERERRTDDALAAARRLAAVATEARGRADALLRVARLERARHDHDAAASALQEAVAIEGPGSESAIEYKALCDSPERWEQYLSALQRHLQSLPEADAGPTFVEMGRVLSDLLERPAAALDLLQRGAELTDDPGLRRELASRLRIAGRASEAVAVLQALAAEDPTRSDVWRELARTYAATERPVEARLATDPLLVLDTASETDRTLRAASPPRPAAARPGSLGPVLEQLGTPRPAQQAAGALLRCIESALPKLYPPDLESYGLSTRDKLTTRTGHPLRALTDKLAAILDVPNYELFVHRTRARGMGTELGNPVMIVVPAAVAELPLAQQVFLLARPLVQIARGFSAVDKLTPRELEVLLSSAARSVDPRHGTGLTSEEVLDAQAKQLHKALSRKQRKALEETAARYVEAGRVDLDRWARAARRTATRVAALLSDDLAACVEVLRRTERELSALSGATLVHESEAIADLLAFWTSEAAMHLRQHSGLIGGA